MKRLKRQQPFLQSVLKQADGHKRNAMLQHANADQINALSELALNLLKRHIPVSPATLVKLQRHKTALRQTAKRRESVKRRRAVFVKQTGQGFWSGLHDCFRACHRTQT